MVTDSTNIGSDVWPIFGVEMRPWERSAGEVASRRALMRSAGDYEASVPVFIEALNPKIEPEVLAAADDATRELTRFDTEIGHIAAPFTSILLRTESAASSEVENLTAGAKQVALAGLGLSKSHNANLIVANTRAMLAALSLADNFNEDTIIEMHRALLEDISPQIVGAFRSEQVWVGGSGFSPHGAIFVPPHHDRVAALIKDFLQFSSRADIPVLVQIAIAHAQFETIHPFADGNGRTGRSIIQAMLKHGGVTKNVAIPVSAGLLSDVHTYFDALTAYRSGDPNQIVRVITDASFAAINNGKRLVAELQEIRSNWDVVVRTNANTTPSRLKDLLLQQPVVTAKLIASELGVSEMTALRAIKQFCDASILRQTNSWKRNRVWHSSEVIDALDSFADRARRNRF